MITFDYAAAAADVAVRALFHTPIDAPPWWTDVADRPLGQADLAHFVARHPDAPTEALWRFVAGRDAYHTRWPEVERTLRVAFEIYRASVLALLVLVRTDAAIAAEAGRARGAGGPLADRGMGRRALRKRPRLGTRVIYGRPEHAPRTTTTMADEDHELAAQPEMAVAGPAAEAEVSGNFLQIYSPADEETQRSATAVARDFVADAGRELVAADAEAAAIPADVAVELEKLGTFNDAVVRHLIEPAPAEPVPTAALPASESARPAPAASSDDGSPAALDAAMRKIRNAVERPRPPRKSK